MKIIYKGIKSLRNNGINITIEKTKKYLDNILKSKIKEQSALLYTKVSEDVLRSQRNTVFNKSVTFSVVTPLYNTPEKFLREMIESVISQSYENWEFCLADGSDENHNFVGEVVAEYMSKYPNIKYKKLAKNRGISENTNDAMDMATGDYICFFDHDDILHPYALYRYMSAIEEDSVDVIYCDEATFENKLRNLKCLVFKPDFAIDNLRCNNYICHFLCVRSEIVKMTGRLNSKYDGAQDFDFVLRLSEITNKFYHVSDILYFWRMSKNSTAKDVKSKPYASEAGRLAVKDHLERVNLEGEVTVSKSNPFIYCTKYSIKTTPLISIIIPNKDSTEILKKCIDSVEKLSTYKNYEIIIVENNSTSNEIFEYYKEIEQNNRIRVLRYEAKNGFNYSLINNYGVVNAKGEYILFLNNDIEVITPSWIEEMLMFAQREDVGAVGAKLYYPNNTIQHGGVILGLGGVAGHCHYNKSRYSEGYFGRLIYPQNFTAVTGACMLVKKSVFNEVGGFGEDLAVTFNDVDLCMKIRKQDYLICWTPFAELYHHESLTRGYEDTEEKRKRFESEVAIFKNRWKDYLEKGDPYYNPNLSLDKNDFSPK